MAIAQRPTFPLSFYQLGRLARLPIAGGAPRELTNEVSAADWTPDGAEIVVARSVDNRTLIELAARHQALRDGCEGW